MADVIVVEDDAPEAEAAEEVTVVAPVIMPESETALQQAEGLGELRALVFTQGERITALESRMDGVEATSSMAADIAITAVDTATEAAIAAEEAATVEPEPLPPPTPDDKPRKQHWLYRERGE